VPRFTAAYSSFAKRLGEVDALCKLARRKERADAIAHTTDISALCRGSVVLLSSHVEAFIKELGEIALDSLYSRAVGRTNLAPQFFYHISKSQISEIKNTADQEKIAEKIFEFFASEHPYWSKTGSFPTPIPTDRFNKGFSNPAYKKISAYFNRFGYTDYKSDLGKRLAGDYQPVINMVDHLVDTRNKIAHGDPEATKTPSEVKDMMGLVQKFCSNTDSVFAKWWRAKFCAIR
jgi:hypothetical protein